MTGTDYWLRQQISLAQWRDFYREAENDRLVAMALQEQDQRPRASQLRNGLGRVLLILATWLMIDDAQPELGSVPLLPSPSPGTQGEGLA